jgi:disulfide bond formation protein DsbB
LTWIVRPSDEDKKKFQRLKVVLAFGVVIAIVFAIASRTIVFSLLGLVVLFASTSEFFLGKKYTLAETVAKAGPNEISWTAVKSVHVMPDMIFLSPFEAESKLDAFRGVKLNIQNVSMESVLEFVRQHVGENVRFLEG